LQLLGAGDLLEGRAAQLHSTLRRHQVGLPVPGAAIGDKGIGGLLEPARLWNHQGLAGTQGLKTLTTEP
jgi:hypothetical protein